MTPVARGSDQVQMQAAPAESFFVKRAGREFIVACYGAARAARLYPPEHSSVLRALDELVEIVEELRLSEGEIEVRFTGEFIFVNETRLRLDLTNYASFGQLLALCRASGIGALRVRGPSTVRDWRLLLFLLDAPAQKSDPEASFELLLQRLAEFGVTVFELEPPTETDAERELKEWTRQSAVRTYAQTVAVTKSIMNSLRMGRTPSVHRIKRLVQTIVDQILQEETSLIGLTTIRDYDEYTFTHSVNVCIFSVALGRRIGMTRTQLYELGMAALFHDIGKSRVPLPVLQKASNLSEEEWRTMMGHTWLGVLAQFQLRGQAEYTYRAMVCAFEHHMKCDLSGYPRSIRPRDMSMTSRIVAIADGYDAATTRRAYESETWSPSAVLKEMRDNARRGMDPIILKAFINLLGVYPPGTLVVLDTFELAIVKAANPNPEHLSRPVVIVISDSNGNALRPPLEADLAEPQNGGFARTIIKTANPERYGIRVSDYLI